jgi:hypothetical protein
MKTVIKFFIVLILLPLISCDNDESTVNNNSQNVTDCAINSDSGYIGICLDGSSIVSQNDLLTYASTSSSNFTEIIWTIESGNIEIIDIENSIENGYNKSIATLQFNYDFSGGIIKVTTLNSNGESAGMLMTIELED